MSFIIPGDGLSIESNINTSIGPGVYKNPLTQRIIPTSAGISYTKVNKKQTNQVVYIDSDSKRYLPQTNDLVIGVVVGVVGESYKIQLQDFLTSVLLSMMAFPNATKKNRPNLKQGQCVYARVSQAISEIETEVECLDESGKEGGFGLLDESGYVFSVKLNFARELLFNASSPILEKLAAKCQFEIAVGMNGKIWIKCGEGLNVKVKEDGEEEEVEQVKVGTNVKDLKATLSAYKYLSGCEKVSPEEFDNVLLEAFK